MDKNLNRQIGWRPTRFENPPKKEVVPKSETPAKQAEPKSDLTAPSVPATSTEIWKWIEANKKYIKIKALCSDVGIDPGNFSRLRKQKGEIPAVYLPKITELLKKFGYGN